MDRRDFPEVLIAVGVVAMCTGLLPIISLIPVGAMLILGGAFLLYVGIGLQHEPAEVDTAPPLGPDDVERHDWGSERE